MSSPDPSSSLPLTPITFHILLAVAQDPLHGYGIMKEVSDRTGGQVHLETGTLYAALKRLVDDDCIEAVPAGERPPGEDRRRRTYRLTPYGVSVLKAEVRRHAEMVQMAAAKEIVAPSTT